MLSAADIINPSRARYAATAGAALHYRERYLAGWRYSMNVGSLDRPDQDGRSSDDAWMDGYLDAATGRDKWHLPTCTDHDNCP